MTELIIPLESELVFAKRCAVVQRGDNDQYIMFSQPYSIQIIMDIYGFEETSEFTYTYHFKDDISTWVKNNIKPVTFDVIPSNQLVAIFENDVDAIIFKMRWL